MKFSNCIKSWCVALTLMLPNVITAEVATDTSASKVSKVAADTSLSKEALANMYNELNATLPEKLSDAFTKEVEDLINTVNCMFGDLACLVQEDAIHIENKEQKSELLKAITQTRKVVNKLLKEFINKPSKSQLDHTLYMVNSIIKQLEQALKEDFITYKPFDPELALKRSVDIGNIDDETLKKQFEDTKEYCKTVQKTSENAGLSAGNHFYRKTFDPIIQWCDKYNVHWKTVGTSVGLAAFVYLWFKFNESNSGLTPEIAGFAKGTNMAEYQLWRPEDPLWKRSFANIHDWINYKVRKYCKWELLDEAASQIHSQARLREASNAYADGLLKNPEAMDKLHRILTDKVPLRPVGLLGKLDYQGHRIAQSWWTPFMTALYIPYKDEVATKYKESKFAIDKKIKEWHNWAKGGAYYQRYKFKKDQGRITPRFDFDNVIGLDYAKHELSKIIKFIEDPERYERAGLTPAMGYLLFGQTRTGKSMLAEATAGEIQKRKGGSSDDFPFFVIEARYIAAEGNFNYVMNLIKNYAPCIIFIDEIDMLNLHRKFKDKNVLLSEFLATISGCMSTDPDKQVIILAATNKPDDLDPSLRSRLSVHIPFEYPSFAHRAESIIRELEGKGLPLDQFDVRKLAEQTEGCSYEQIHKIVNNAQFISRETGKPVTQTDIERSLNTEVRNIIYHDYKDLSEDELNILSIHMAGHALAYTLIEGKSEQFSQVTIRPVKSKIEDESQWKEFFTDQHRPIIQYGHIFTHLTGDSLKFMSKDDKKRKCMIELAGRVAEEVVLGTCFITKDSCSAHDKARAFYWAKQYSLNGLDERVLEGSKAMQNKIVEQACTFVESCENEMRMLFEDHKKLITFLAEGLKKFESFGADEISAMIDLHSMMGDKTIEEFIKELEEQSGAKNDKQGASEEGTDDLALSENELSKAVQDELDIQEVPALNDN